MKHNLLGLRRSKCKIIFAWVLLFIAFSFDICPMKLYFNAIPSIEYLIKAIVSLVVFLNAVQMEYEILRKPHLAVHVQALKVLLAFVAIIQWPMFKLADLLLNMIIP